MTDKPIDKIEAAGRQLDGACRLRLTNEDSLIIHTLGFAAFGILERSRSSPRTPDERRARHTARSSVEDVA
jgi:hypothetical protein